MAGWRVKRNDFAKVATKLQRGLDGGVDRFTDEMVPALASKVRHRTGASADTTRNYAEGRYHATLGIGIHRGVGFYIRFYEWGTHNPNRYGNIVPAEHNVQETAEFYTPVYYNRIAQEVARACR